MKILLEANQLFKQKEFDKAYELYLKVADEYGLELVKYNLEKCKKQMSKQKVYPENEEESILNEYFDHIYVVNLKNQVHQRLKIALHLLQHNIKFQIFEATNGYKGEAFETWQTYQKRPIGRFERFKHYSQEEIQHKKPFIESAGAIGYIYTYLKVLKDAKAKGYKRFLILEDDVILANDFLQAFKKFISLIDDDWKVLQLGVSQYGWQSVDRKKSIQRGFYLPRARDTKGSFAVAFDHSVLDEVIELQSAFEAPFDHIPMSEIYEQYLNKCFVAFPYMVMPDVTESTIRGKRCQYEHSERMHWDVDNFDYPLSKPSISVLIKSKKNLKYFSSFSQNSSRAFDLRLYFFSSDGLRPLHNEELLDLEINKVNIAHPATLYSESDFTVTLEDEDVLTEDSIVNFIEFKLGLKTLNISNLHEIVFPKKEVIPGRVSVIIPTYKRPKNLRLAIESVVKQEYKDIELIVVSDNGENSKYNKETKKIVSMYENINPQCKVILLEHRVNRNGAAARNTGILYSSGEYITFLDDDDIYLPERLSKSIEVLEEERKSVGGVYCGFLGWNSKQNDMNRYAKGNLTREILELEYHKHYLHTNTATYRREAVLNINGFDESYRRHQDLEFNLRFFEKYEISVVKETLVRLNPEKSDVNNKVYNRSMLALKQKFLEQFKYLIEQYPRYVQYNIYSLHQDEALRYIQKKKEVLRFYKEDFTNYTQQMLLKLAYTIDSEKMALLDTKNQKVSAIGFYRIIGNNMPFLQSNEQSLENILKIITEESNFPSTDKYFVINRITDKKFKQKIIDLLEEAEQSYLEIPFEMDEFKTIGYSFSNIPNPNIWFSNLDEWERLVANTELREAKNRYLMNNNGARNFALKHGKKRYKWTMPWDGNCFISDDDFKNLNQIFEEKSEWKYIATLMQRVFNNSEVNKSSIAKNAIEEPQISFRDDSSMLFNEKRVYGNQPKIDLFKRIGYKGKWDEWKQLSPWIKLNYQPSKDFGMVTTGGAVFRLSSGNEKATKRDADRNIIRKKGICDFIDQVEAANIKNNLENIEFQVQLPLIFKEYLDNETLQRYNHRLILGGSVKEQESIIAELYTMYNDHSDEFEKVYIITILFAHKFLDKSRVVVTKEIEIIMDGGVYNLYKEIDLTKSNTIVKMFSNILIALLCKLNEASLLDAIKLKVELSMLLYFYINKRDEIEMEDTQNFKSIIEIIQVLFAKVFNYAIDSDLNLE